ncbi:hypothetical protein, partial [Rothia terrae]
KMYLGHVKVLLGMFLSLKTLYRKRTVIWPFYFYTIIRTLSKNCNKNINLLFLFSKTEKERYFVGCIQLIYRWVVYVFFILAIRSLLLKGMAPMKAQRGRFELGIAVRCKSVQLWWMRGVLPDVAYYSGGER